MKLYSSTKGGKYSVENMNRYGVGLLMLDYVNPGRFPFFAVDNGAFSMWKRGEKYDFSDFLRVLDRLRVNKYIPDFVVVPDSPANAKETLDFAREWIPRLRHYAFPLYITVQDGMTERDIDEFIGEVQGIFVGGTLEWKWKNAKRWIEYAHRNGLRVHIGRAGTWRDIVRARVLGADSIDSSSWTRNRAFYHVDIARSQIALVEVSE